MFKGHNLNRYRVRKAPDIAQEEGGGSTSTVQGSVLCYSAAGTEGRKQTELENFSQGSELERKPMYVKNGKQQLPRSFIHENEI